MFASTERTESERSGGRAVREERVAIVACRGPWGRQAQQAGSAQRAAGASVDPPALRQPPIATTVPWTKAGQAASLSPLTVVADHRACRLLRRSVQGPAARRATKRGPSAGCTAGAGRRASSAAGAERAGWRQSGGTGSGGAEVPRPAWKPGASCDLALHTHRSYRDRSETTRRTLVLLEPLPAPLLLCTRCRRPQASPKLCRSRCAP